MTAAADMERLAGKLGASANLLGVRLVAIEARDTNLDPQPPFDLAINVAGASGVEDGVLTYELTYRVDVNDVGGGETMVLTCTYLVGYALPDGLAPSQEERDAFQAVTVIFTVHPYLRELLQSIAARFEMPSITLDVMRRPLPAAKRSAPKAGAKPKPGA